MKKILTIIFDGFGIRDEVKGNAVKAANMHNFDGFWNKYPHTTLYASEERVGLLKGQMGNSEVGHMTIGAGRLIKSNMDKISDFFNSPDSSPAFSELVSDPNKRVHLVGLCSDGNIHASITHFIQMYELLVSRGFSKIYFHLITDGRDTAVDVSYNYVKTIEDLIKKHGVGKIATLCGRFYAMDRDNKYDRTKVFYDVVAKGIGKHIIDIKKAIEDSYANNTTDEFIKPLVCADDGIIQEGDSVIWINYRADRAKQFLDALVNGSKFEGFATRGYTNLPVYTLFPIDKAIKTNAFIPEEVVDNPLGIYFSKLGLKQARVAESEKYPHVTYFFDGGFNGKVEGCDKFHIESPQVATYDLKPEMSCVAVCRKVIECMEKDYDFIFVNFANPDMVGHTGDMDAATKACMAVDVCLGKLIESAEDNFYTIILMADHGNCDTMINDDGSICTTHSLAKVPFIISDQKVKLRDDGDLTNVAPTILDYMDIAIPSQMTSESLIEE